MQGCGVGMWLGGFNTDDMGIGTCNEADEFILIEEFQFLSLGCLQIEGKVSHLLAVA